MRKYRKFGKGKTLKELVDYVKIPKKKIDEPLIYSFEHFYNPWHFYARLRELDISVKEAKEMCVIYETKVYKPIIDLIRKE